MTGVEDSEPWRPDDALVHTVRTRCLPISTLSGPDRSWVVASLTVQGWTVRDIAERLQCSLRLIQMVKAEPMTRVSVYALELSAELTALGSLRQLETLAHLQRLAALEADVERLRRQRDALINPIRKAARNDQDQGR